MAGEVGCFGKKHKKQEKSLKKELLRNSRILLGDMRHIPSNVRRIFELGLPENHSKCSNFFAPFETTPEEFDKLRFERQTFPQWKVQREFQKLHYRQRIRLKKRKIYILPIGPFPNFVFQDIPGLTLSLFELLSNYISVFYLGFSAEIMEVKDLSEISCQTRVHPGTGKLQILVGDVLSYLKEHRPSDGFCILGISWQDLYPGDEWNFVLGEASCEDGCAAISFGHHEPKSSEKLSALLKKQASLSNFNVETFKENGGINEIFENKFESLSAKHDTKLITDSIKDSLVSSENTNETRKGNERMVIDEKVNNTKLITDSTKESVVSSENTSNETRKGKDSRGTGISFHVEKSLQELAVTDDVNHSLVDIDQGNCSVLENDPGRMEKIDAFEVWKFFRVVSHELGHIFGITHCSYFTCAMNESTSIAEAVNQPLFMCPVCLRKIQYAAGFDILDRYSRLWHFLEVLLLQEGFQGKGDDSNGIPRNHGTDDQNFGVGELGKIAKAVSWIDSVLNYLHQEYS